MIQEKKLLISALRSSGEVLRGFFDKPLIEKCKESQSSIVTEADIESEKIILGLIQEQFPNHNILSEERGFINRRSEYTWIVDPLDGTSNFAAGIPWYGVLITLMMGNDPVLGGAYVPVADSIYIAQKGKGAERNREKLKKITGKSLDESLVAFSVDYTNDDEFLGRGLELYRRLIEMSRNVRSTNSLLDFIYTAEGRFGCAINLFTRIWDIAGLYLLFLETGGKMVNIDGSPLQFSLSDDIINENYAVIAGPEGVINQLCRIYNSNK